MLGPVHSEDGIKVLITYGNVYIPEAEYELLKNIEAGFGIKNNKRKRSFYNQLPITSFLSENY